jgi:hypothetical protein
MAKKRKHPHPDRYRSHFDAIVAANRECPIGPELINDTRQMLSIPLRTKDDFRWFVLFNLLHALLWKLKPTTEDTFLYQAQDNIRTSAEKYL